MIALLLAASALQSQIQPPTPAERIALLDRLVRSNSYSIWEDNGRLTGPGEEFLIREAKNAQFVGLGENHMRMEIPQITTMLFRDLQSHYDFQHLAMESAVVATGLLNGSPYRGNVEQIRAFARRYPYGLTFRTDQETQMIADVGGASHARSHPIWGLDQEFGVMPILDLLQPKAKTDQARQAVQQLRDKVAPFEAKRPGTFFLGDIASADDFIQLKKGFDPKPGSDEEFMIDQLAKSQEIYNYYRLAVKGEPTGWKNCWVREDNMKDLFMREYRDAQKRGEKLPKAVLKFGQYHLYRGLNPSLDLSTGNFVSDLAKSNGMAYLNVFFTLHNSEVVPADHGYDFLRPFLERCDTKAWTVIDLRPIRDYYVANQLPPQNGEFVRMVFGFDALFVLGSSKPATTEKVEGN